MYSVLTPVILEAVNETYMNLSKLLFLTGSLFMGMKCLSLAKPPFTKDGHPHTL